MVMKTFFPLLSVWFSSLLVWPITWWPLAGFRCEPFTCHLVSPCADVLHVPVQIRPDSGWEQAFVSIILNMPSKSDRLNNKEQLKRDLKDLKVRIATLFSLLIRHQEWAGCTVIMPVCRWWCTGVLTLVPCLRVLSPGILGGFIKFSFVLSGPLCCSSGPGGEDWIPVSRLYRGGGSRERRDHVHLRAFAGSAGQSHGGEHPHRWPIPLT